jgi:cysteinyl-tRNA synthetase
MPIRIYNTAKQMKEEFVPLQPGRVGIYACGVTVYDLCHIGHARSALVFDVLVRYLRARGLKVTFVRNFTDVDDKIINRARELGKEPQDLAEQYIRAYYEDMDRLGIMRADVEPRATQHIDGMLAMIQTLIAKDHAYVEGSDVYFSIESFKGYGGLSGRKLDDMQAGSRVAIDERKRHPMDFALWKGAKPGEPQWPSPWGPGRPGWHIECSVMSAQYLGETFDIHAGGADLLFPHHENERAQSLAAGNGQFARYWMHNGMLDINAEKMSKSLGNFITIRDALKTYHPEVLRLFFLSKHYRSPLDFTPADVGETQSALVRIYRTLERLDSLIGPTQNQDRPSAGSALAQEPSEPFLKAFIENMDDDLNTAGALGLVFEKVKELNRMLDGIKGPVNAEIQAGLQADRRNLLLAGRIMGLLNQSPIDFFKELAAASAKDADAAEIEKLIAERKQARADKDWARADAIRKQLDSLGIVLEDGAKGTTWRYKV